MRRRPFLMHRSTLVLLLALTGLTLVPYPGGPAAASCAAPSVDLREGTVLRHGARTSIEGRGFATGCTDSIGCTTIGCADHCEDPPPEEPMDDVELVLLQGGRHWPLAEVDADDDGRVRWTFELPRAARPGPARITADAAGAVRITIR